VGPDGCRRQLISLQTEKDGATPRGVVPSFLLYGLGLAPFLGLVVVFLVIPAIGVFVQAFHNPDGSFGFGSMRDAISGQNLDAFFFSFGFSFGSATVGSAFGLVVAYAISVTKRPRWVRGVAMSFSGVTANMGGVLLAFAFLSLLGRQGVLTKVLGALGWDLYAGDFNLGSTVGLIVVYSYFNIPLMVLVSLAAVENMKVTWREACANLGGNSTTYWWRIGLPVLSPSIISGFLLLFANSFSAYATARALTDNSKIVPLRIGFFLSGDIKTGTDSLGYALAAWMIIVMAVCIALYWIARSRAERWQRA